MFNPLTRALKLGLTAITILTAGGFAGTAFAQTFANDRVGYCANNPTNILCGSTEAARLDVASCIRDPFGTSCARTFTPKELIVAKTRYCGSATNRVKLVCTTAQPGETTAILERPNAANWAKRNPDALDVPTRPAAGMGRWGKFLKGTADGLNEGDATHIWRQGSLNLKTATFNGVALGGDATDGVAFFSGTVLGGVTRPFSGIFSGTDLGAPVTELSGTAKWVGRFQFGDETSAKDFVLEVDFDNKTVDALVKEPDPYTWSFYLAGNYDNSGIITGNFEHGLYENKERRIVTANYGDSAFFRGTFRGIEYGSHVKGVVTGLIGQDGAVGAFTTRGVDLQGMGTISSSGGFVARPAEVVDGAVAYLDGICEADPFHELCFTSNQRATRILADCAGTLPSPRPAHCSDATVACVNDPFGTNCHRTLGGYALGIARAPRITLCNRESTLISNPLCTPTEVVDAVCEANPFGLGCLNHTADVIKYNTARLKLATFCNRNMSDDKCRGIVTTANICSQLPFDSICNTGYDDQRLERAELCVNNNGVDPLCDPQYVTTANICSQLPFDSTCDSTRFEYRRTERIIFCNDVGTPRNNPRCTPTEVVDAVCDNNLFGVGCLRYSNDNSNYNNKRTVRITTCNEAGGASNPLCMPADVVAAICDNNLFGTGCLRSSIHNSDRANILNSCTTDSGNSDCTDLNLNSVCSYAPFSPLCLDNDDYASKREDTFESCKSRDSDILSCNGVRQVQAPSGKADAATWADSLITLNNPKGVSSITSVDLSYDPYRENPYRKSQFVEGLEVLEEGFNLLTRGKTPFTFLTLADNLVGSSTETLGGQSEDGVAFFGLKVGYGEFPYYAGILSGTDLGAPITGITGTVAIWSGVFQAIGGQGRAIKRNFDLTVTFTDSKTGEIDAFVNSTDDNYYHLTGDFDSIGVITGTVDYGSFTDGNRDASPTGDRIPGRLTGLIGEQGAVGAFIADMDGHRGFYAGGFVARETTVNYADWEAEADPLAAIGTSTVNQFLAGGTDTLLDTTTRSTVLNLADATHNRIGLGGDSTDGVAFFKNPERGFNALYYAGVLSGTDLGLPIEPGASGDWKGSIRIVYGSGIWNAVDFNLTVTLGGTADDVNQAGIITAEAENILIDNGQKSLHINGKFNYKGVIIKGTVDLGGGGYATGILTGLIGQEGAVGAFISNGSSPFSGGFVARPDLVQVTSANLATLQTKPRDITNSGFLTASSAGLDIEDSSLPQGHTLSGEQMILRRGGADSDNPDGIAYFFTTADSGNTSHSYGGILSTTNLGAPVESTQTSAIWKGHHSYRDSLIENEKTDFYVNFAEGKFGFTNDGRNGIGSVVMTPFANNPEVTFTLNGLFGSQNNMTVGQLGGTLDYTFTTQTALDGGKYQPGDTVLYQYNVHGLIGQEGAVGVYLEESVNASRVGGFVASAQ